MTYELNETITNPASLIADMSNSVSSFGPMLLIFVWASITLIGYISQDKKTNRGNISMWLTIGGFFTTSLSFLLFLMNGILNLYTVITCVSLFLLSALWFLFSDRE